MTDIARDVAQEYGYEADLAEMDTEPAGTRAFLFLPSWVPIADDTGGDLLFVDLRPGDLHGCVGRWWNDDGFHGPDYGTHFWTSVAHMAQSIADALEAGRWAPDDSGEHDMEPTVIDGSLHWEDAEDEETIEASAGPSARDLSELRNLILLYGRQRPDAEIAERLGVPISTVTDLKRQIEAERADRWDR